MITISQYLIVFAGKGNFVAVNSKCLELRYKKLRRRTALEPRIHQLDHLGYTMCPVRC